MATDFIAGCIGGCAGVVVGHPFDTIKVRLQTQDFRNPIYRGTFDCFKSIIKNDSVSGLFRGMSSPMAGVAVVNAIVFGVQGNLQRRLPNPESLSSHFVSGTAAGISQSIFCSPMEMIKTRLQVQQQQIFKTPWECLSYVSRTEGLRGVFRGLGITALREGPGFGSYFLVYELLTRTESNEPISTTHMLLAGGTAGSASWLLAYPIDVIKTRLQVDGMDGPRLYKNAWDCCKKSVQAEGLRCLTRGLNLTLVRAFPVNAATWAAVTWVIRFAENKKIEENTYTKLSELTERKIYLPELPINTSFCAPAQTPKNLYRDKETLTRLSINACIEESNIFQQLLKSIHGSLYEM